MPLLTELGSVPPLALISPPRLPIRRPHFRRVALRACPIPPPSDSRPLASIRGSNLHHRLHISRFALFAFLCGCGYLRHSASICGHLVRPSRKNRNRVNRVNGVIDHTPFLARSSRQRSALRAAAASTMRSARPSRRDVPLAAAINQNGAPRKGMTTA